MPSGAAAMGDGVIKRREIGERRRWAFARRIAKMVVEATVRFCPRLFVDLLKPFTKPFAHQRMRIERLKIGRIDRREQPPIAQTRDGAPPLFFTQPNERVG